MVLKFSCFKKRTSACGGVSVPLRGYGFEIRLNPKIGGAGGATVSVPLRGYGFEIYDEDDDYDPVEEFPSPCGDMVLKLRL